MPGGSNPSSSAIDRDEALRAECDVEIFRAGGPGGQHRNKTQNAVRLRHRPTGIVATARERRSLAQNLAQALDRLRERLAARVPPRPRVATRPTVGAKRRRIEAKRHRGTIKRQRRADLDD